MESGGIRGAPRGAPADAGPWRALTLAIVAAAVVAALVVLILSAMTTSSARVAATTTSNGLLSAGTVAISRPGQTTSVFFNTDGLYPGLEVRGCVVAQYDGSVDALIRLSGQPDGGRGLDEYVDLSLSVLPGDMCPDDGRAENSDGDTPIELAAEEGDEQPARELYSGRLDDFWQTHSNFATGLDVAPVVEPGERIVIETVVTVVDDNRAAGLDTELSITFEGRPV